MFQVLMSSVMLQCTQRNIQIPYSSTDGKWTVLALDLAALLAPVTTAAFEETKSIQFCANMVVRGAFTADNSYTRQVRSSPFLHAEHYRHISDKQTACSSALT